MEIAESGAAGLSEVSERRPNLVLLDLGGLEIGASDWLKILRQMALGKDMPVIVFGESASDEQAVEAFQGGVDDYIVKPCDPAELAARIRAVLRRRYEREEQLGEAVSLGPITLDLLRHQCRAGRKAVELRQREFELLEILMRNSGRVLKRGYLLETVWGMDHSAQTRTVDVAVSRLRRALGKRAGRWIETIEGYGYRFRASEELTR